MRAGSSVILEPTVTVWMGEGSKANRLLKFDFS